jgi:NADH-quinone oxidoreductase subunit E
MLLLILERRTDPEVANLQILEKDKSNIIKALQLIQNDEGFISEQTIKEIADFFSVSPVEVEGIVSFYAQFKRDKPGRYRISVCDGTACHIKGSPLVLNWVSDELGIKNNETDKDGLFSLQTVACLGCCSLAPVMSINGKVYGKLDRKSLLKILKKYRRGDVV